MPAKMKAPAKKKATPAKKKATPAKKKATPAKKKATSAKKKATSAMSSTTFSAPVAKLFSYGHASSRTKWPNYVEELGLRAEHVAELIDVVVRSDLSRMFVELDPVVRAAIDGELDVRAARAAVRRIQLGSSEGDAR